MKALVRQGSEKKLAATSCEICRGDALDADSYNMHVAGCDTFIHLVGVAHPSPAKAREFVSIDLRSAQEAIRAAAKAAMPHFIYLSVAQPAPVMKSYIAVRAACESSLRDSGLNATIVRPWYVLGPGHRWPVVLQPLYALARLVPSTRDGALRLGLVDLKQMIYTLLAAVEDPASGIRLLQVPDIRRLGSSGHVQSGLRVA